MSAAPPFAPRASSAIPKVTICVLTYGNYPGLARQAIDSIRRYCPRAGYRLLVGANVVCAETLDYLQRLSQNGDIDQLIISDVNLNKNPMMRRMFEQIDTEFIWWFDDDSYIFKDGTFSAWLEIADGKINWKLVPLR